MYIRILENDDWIVEYDAENNQYRVGYFQDNHFVDEILFDACKGKKRLCVESEEGGVNCGNCRHGDHFDSYHLIYCYEHNAIMSDDNCCRYWSDEDEI